MKVVRTAGLIILVLFVMGGKANAQALPSQTTLSWTISSTTTVTGYNVYRLTGACPTSPSISAFTKVNTALVTPLTYTDATVTGGTQYCYTVTAVSPAGESGIANMAQVTIPTIISVTITQPPGSLGISAQ